MSSVTTLSPPFASIFNNSDWKLPGSLDVYLHFNDIGDTYLGRCLTGLDPNEYEFSTLTPHLNMDTNPLEDKKLLKI